MHGCEVILPLDSPNLESPISGAVGVPVAKAHAAGHDIRALEVRDVEAVNDLRPGGKVEKVYELREGNLIATLLRPSPPELLPRVLAGQVEHALAVATGGHGKANALPPKGLGEQLALRRSAGKDDLLRHGPSASTVEGRQDHVEKLLVG